jgi:tetratricopeptide (TPR) repeat protein
MVGEEMAPEKEKPSDEYDPETADDESAENGGDNGEASANGEKMEVAEVDGEPKVSGEAKDDVDKAFQKEIETEMSDVCKTSWFGHGRDAVRDVFRRACLVHCPNKAMVRMKWAAFEEDAGDLDAAKNILYELSNKFPLLLECSMQLADIERRAGHYDKAEDVYKKLMKKIPQNRQHIKTWVSLKLARFQFKVFSQPDKALATLRSAVKKERGDPRLYSQIIDICYQRNPVDVPGVTAAIELAIVSNELNNLQKLEFVKRKVNGQFFSLFFHSLRLFPIFGQYIFVCK